MFRNNRYLFERFQKLTRIYKYNNRFNFNKALTSKTQGNLLTSLEEFKKCYELNQKNEKIINYISKTFLLTGNF